MSREKTYRNLAEKEISTLKANGCVCDDWSRITVKDGFNPDSCINVTFSGDVKLGVFTRKNKDISGVEIRSGIYNARIHNCNIASDVTISNIGEYIANYSIEEQAVISNCGKIFTEGVTSFGNGIQVSVLNEAGGRKVKIWDRLSAHEAYILTLYRHKTKAIENIGEMIDEYASGISSSIGIIGKNSRISNCSKIRNTRIGEFTSIDSALSLDEGSINSSVNDPVKIGYGVILDNFIISSGSMISDSAILSKCFVGQGCVIGRQFSAENSLFFSNCQGFHGEACSVFAGPYTTTHHKSTLLIAGLFSFMNAGSGTNQSNHMYKLGPVHQGIMERGSKTASGSFILWPAHIGPFSMIMGKHYSNPDISDLPFSYLIEGKEGSMLYPGINLGNAGTIRDCQKWPLRDRRQDQSKIDKINFSLLNPYITMKIIRGRDILLKLSGSFGEDSDMYYYQNLKIKRSAIKRGIKLYQTAINKSLGNFLISRIEGSDFNSIDDLIKCLIPESSVGRGKWIDMAGLIVPLTETELLLGKIENKEISELKGLDSILEKMHSNYNKWAWTWACEQLEFETGKKIQDLSAEEIIQIVVKWKDSILELDDLLCSDLMKEFSGASLTGYGVDGDLEIQKLDFLQVRGEFEKDKYAMSIKDHSRTRSERADKIIRSIQMLKK